MLRSIPLLLFNMLVLSRFIEPGPHRPIGQLHMYVEADTASKRTEDFITGRY